MRIAQVAPLYESVPPKLYGGTERVVSYLTEELVRHGHEVTLFASGDSQTERPTGAGLPEGPVARRKLPRNAAASRPADGDWSSRTSLGSTSSTSTATTCTFPSCGAIPARTSRRCTARCTWPDTRAFFEEYAEMPLVSISNDQRRPMPWANWQATVYHGLPRDITFLPSSTGRLPGVSRPHFSRKAARPGDRHRPAGRHEAQGRRQDLSGGTRATTKRRSSRCCANRSPGSSSSARSAAGTRTSFWAMRTHCCFRSTGRSRSAW